MKFGAHTFIFASEWSDQHLPILAQARELGLDCFELSVGDDSRFAPHLTRAAAEALGLELFASPGGLWPQEYDISLADPQHRQAGLAFHRRMIHLAAAAGATAYTGALYGHPGTVPRRLPQPAELSRTAEGLALLAEEAQTSGLRLVIEPMSHFRTHLVNRPEQAIALIQQAGHPNLGLLLDTYHMLSDIRDFPAAFRTAGSYLWGVHACENDRGAPGGGLVPWEAVFQTLHELNFSGPVLMESYNSSLDGFAVSRGLFHDVCPDAGAFIRHGLCTLRYWQHKVSGT